MARVVSDLVGDLRGDLATVLHGGEPLGHERLESVVVHRRPPGSVRRRGIQPPTTMRTSGKQAALRVRR